MTIQELKSSNCRVVAGSSFLFLFGTLYHMEKDCWQIQSFCSHKGELSTCVAYFTFHEEWVTEITPPSPSDKFATIRLNLPL